jgi:hypothetical protein
MPITGPIKGKARQDRFDSLLESSFKPQMPEEIKNDPVARAFFERNQAHADLQPSDYDTFCLLARLHSRLTKLEILADNDPSLTRQLLDMTRTFIALTRLFAMSPKDRRLVALKGFRGDDKDDFDF